MPQVWMTVSAAFAFLQGEGENLRRLYEKLAALLVERALKAAKLWTIDCDPPWISYVMMN
jgi:hypothetical protein